MFKKLQPFGLLFICFFVCLSLPLDAQVQIEQRRPAPAAGSVSIDSAFGSVIVRGWENQEVLVKGLLAAGVDDLDLDVDQDGVDLDVDNPEAWFYAAADDSEFRSRLEVYIPSGSSLSVETVNAEIDVEGVRGEIELSSVNGPIRAAGDMTSAEVETMTGTVQVDATSCPFRVKTISGAVRLSGATQEVEVETASASVEIEGRQVTSLDVETVVGDVSFQGSLTERGELEVETFSGNVTLVLPESIKAEFELITFSGAINSALGPKILPGKRFQPYQRQRFSTGSDQLQVEVQTHEGNIELRVADLP